MTARVRLRSADDSERELPIGVVRARDLRAASPWRTFRSHRNQRHYSGWYWSSTIADHVIYESRLELARLLLADADPDVVGIVAQPFLLIEGVEANPRRHVPDFFLEHRSGACTVVNVKPARKLNDAKVAATLAWAREVVEAKGWVAEVWTDATPWSWPTSGSSPATGEAGCSTGPRSKPPRRRSSTVSRPEAP